MSKLHAINGGGNQVDEIMVGDIKYVRADKIVQEQQSTESAELDYEKLGVTIGMGIAQAMGKQVNGGVTRPVLNSPAVIPKGLNRLPSEKKGNELAALLYSKLPASMRHPARFRTFYTDFERDTGIGLYAYHKERISKLSKGVDVSRYPYRKADSIFMLADEKEVFNYVKEYEFKF